MSALLQALGHANKLNEIHELVRGLYREKFDQRVADYESLMRKVAEPDGNLIAAATKMCGAPRTDPREQLLILAVAVELTKRDKKAPVRGYMGDSGNTPLGPHDR